MFEIELQQFIRTLETQGRNPRKEGNRWMAFCPSHPDGQKRGRRSLSIGVGQNGQVILNCFAGCKFEDILRDLGISAPPSSSRSAANLKTSSDEGNTFFDYTDKQGNPLYRVVRTPAKKFRMEVPDSSGGWKIAKGDISQKVPFRLPRVLEAIKREETIFVVEGEKCVCSLEDLDLVATTSANGASGARQWEKWGEYFKDAKIVILPDNDEPGRKFAREVEEHLAGVAEVSILFLPGLPEKGDVADFIEEKRKKGKGKDEIREELLLRSKRVQESSLGFTVDEIPEDLPPLRWLIPGILHEGLTILAGRPKTGKSILALNWAMKCAREGKKVLFYALEDSKRRIAERTKNFSKEPLEKKRKLRFFNELPRIDKHGGIKLERDIQRHNPDLVVIDVLARIQPKSRGRNNAYIEEYAQMEYFQNIIAAFPGISLLLVHHTRKGKSENIFDDISGSTAIAGCADCLMILEKRSGERVLHIRGRDVEEQNLALSFDPKSFTMNVLGDAKEHFASDARKAILDALRQGPLAPKDIAKITGKNPSTTRRLLQEMLADEQIEKDAKGKYRLPSSRGGEKLSHSLPLSPSPSYGKSMNGMNGMNGMNSMNGMNGMNSVEECSRMEATVHARGEEHEQRKRPNGGQSGDAVHAVHGVHADCKVVADYGGEKKIFEGGGFRCPMNPNAGHKRWFLVGDEKRCAHCRTPVFAFAEKNWRSQAGE